MQFFAEADSPAEPVASRAGTMTLRSMTGFGRARGAVGAGLLGRGRRRSVNHRFLELTRCASATPRRRSRPRSAAVFAQRLSRGKVEVALRLTRTEPRRRTVSVDERLLESLLARIAELSRKYPIRGELEARDLVAIPQLFSIGRGRRRLLGPRKSRRVGGLAEEAAAAARRDARGGGGQDRRGAARRIGALEGKLAPLAARRDEIVRSIAATLRERMQRSSSPSLPLDSGRLEQEAALAAERSDVSEELARLTGHLAQFRRLLAGGPGRSARSSTSCPRRSCGRSTRWARRRATSQLARDVLEMKAETEKIREQVQNVE